MESFVKVILEILQSTYVQAMIVSGVVYFSFIFNWYQRLHKSIQKIQRELEKDVYNERTPQERIVLFDQWIKKEKFPSVITDQWNYYFKEYSKSRGQMVPDVYEFFTEEDFIQKYGLRKFVESVPAIFVSIGILGTFYGITEGIKDLNPTGPSDELKSGIEELINGMKIAFHSSIAGIVISLVLQFIDKVYLYKQLSNSFYQLLYTLDNSFPIKSESHLLEQLVEIQRTQMDDLKTFLADEMIAKMTSGISQLVVEGLNPHLEKSNQIMERIAENTMNAHHEKMNEMVQYFVNSLNEVTGDHMKQLGEALNKTIEWQEKVHTEMSGLVDELKVVAIHQAEMAKNTTDLTEKMNQYTETLANYQEKLIETTSSLHEVADENKQLLESMSELHQKMNEERNKFNESFNQQLQTLNDTVGHLNKTTQGLEALQKENESFLQRFNVAANIFKDFIKHQTELTQRSVELTKELGEYSQKLNEYQDGISAATEELKKVTVENKELFGKVKEMFEVVGEERAELEQILTNQMRQFTEAVTNMANQTELLKNLQEEIHVFVQTFNATTNEVQSLTTSNAELSGNLAKQLERSAEVNEELQHMLKEITEHHHMSSKMQNYFEQLFAQISGEYQKLDESRQQFVKQLKEQLEQMDKRVNELKGFWHANNEQLVQNCQLFANINSKLDDSMENFANNMHQGLNRTFDQFDKQLGKAVEYLERGVNSIRTVIETMEDDIERVNSTIVQFHKVLEQAAVTKSRGEQ
jgi:chromosome segregation ATPase